MIRLTVIRMTKAACSFYGTSGFIFLKVELPMKYYSSITTGVKYLELH